MNTYISFLRGINVAGQKKIKMSSLKVLYESLGFKNVTTYIQSGNVIFQSTKEDIPVLQQKIEQKIQKEYNFTVTTIIRTIPEMKNIIDGNPFMKERHEDITKLYVTFLSQRPSLLAIQELNHFQKNEEEFIISGKNVYLFIPKGYGKAILSNNLIERKLHVTATTRNWKTVLQVGELAESVATNTLKG